MTNFMFRSNSNGMEDKDGNMEKKDVEKDILVVNGINTVVKNVTARRHQDSEMNDVHLEGYIGNVKRHPQHVVFDPNVNDRGGQIGPNPVHKILLNGIDRANKDNTMMTPGIMEQKLGPTNLSGSLGYATSDDDVIVKLVPTSSSAEKDFMIEAEAISLVNCKLLPTEHDLESFNNLILKPVYWSELKLKPRPTKRNIASPLQGSNGTDSSKIRGKSAHVHPLQSSFYPHMMSVTMCFTSQTEGYLYHLPGHIRYEYDSLIYKPASF